MAQLTTIKTFTYPHEAYVIRGKLESEGIRTFLKDEMTVQVYNFYSNAVGGVKLQVFAEDADKALDILDNVEKPSREVAVFCKKEIEDTLACPFCRSENISRMKKPNWLTLIPFLIVGFIFPVYRSSYICFECGKHWILKK
ncbi:MAG: DUF2007 domain-containing protein [Proteiniphilum sp.]|nr:DUF2007 domain-containing protein [Proteiniphilum sp.]